jgi:hypothetical protein
MSGVDVVIRRARMPRAPRARPVLEHWLARLDVRDWGLPPEAIVALRHAQVPASRVGCGAPSAALSPLLRGAARPARGDAVGATCAAVWFADEAELLACLATDALDGALTERWWWTLLDAGRAAGAGIDGAWSRWHSAPRAAPFALHRLGADRARAWLASGGPAMRARLVDALATAWPVPAGLRDAIARSEPAVVASVARVQMAGAWASGNARVGTPGATLADAPPASTAGPLAPPAEGDGVAWLHALCRVLVEAPQRAQDLAAIAQRVRAAASRAGAAPGVTEATRPVTPATPGLGRGVAAPVEAAGRDAMLPDAGGPPAGTPAPPRQACATPAAPVISAPIDSGPAVRAKAPSGRAAIAATEREPARRRTAPLRAAAPDAPAPVFDTRFGGLFFLLNVATALGLYGDFTQPQHRGLPGSPWRWLYRAGRAALGRRLRADPLAAWLRAQEGALPAPSCVAVWDLDPALLAPFSGDARPRHALVAENGLSVWHPAGFVLAWRAQGTAGDVEPGTILHRVRRCTPRADPWSLTWPLVRVRLAAALGLPPHAALALTFELPARLHARDGRVDLRFALASLPLALRFAGLDRDPGWLPAAGADIRFHFD